MSKHNVKLTKVLIVFLFTMIVLKNAWIMDDAYITFRTVDNFINGYGLTWNTGERVQTYTHPLWMFLMSGVYFFTHEIYYSSLLLSLIISLATFLLLAFGIAQTSLLALLSLIILVFSKSFIDYSTSGLENPLTHLLLVIFLFIYLRRDITLKTLFILSCVAGLATLNRMDTLLLYLPALIYTFIKLRNLKGIYVVIAGFLPFILWEIFSLFYYGFLFPNTAYAKLNTGLATRELVSQGLSYLWSSLEADPLTPLTIVIGILVTFMSKIHRNIFIAVGILLYLLYTVRIGGDFMLGRFLAAPLLGAVVLLSRSHLYIHRLGLTMAFGLVIFIGLISPYSPFLTQIDHGEKRESNFEKEGISDEQANYYQASGLFSKIRTGAYPNHRWGREGKEAKRQDTSIVVRTGIGYFGFYAGPDVHIVDILALGDPLLARLSPTFNPKWVIGHFGRRIPDGYLESLDSGQNKIRDKRIAAYYDKLAIITKGDILNSSRLVEILNFNLGRYNHLIEPYPPIFQLDAQYTDSKTRDSYPEADWTHIDGLEQYAGLQINLNRVYHTKTINITTGPLQHPKNFTEHQFRYYIRYLKEGSQVAFEEIDLPSKLPNEFVSEFPVPEVVALEGFDTVQIFPERGQNLHETIYIIRNIKLIN